MKSTGALLLRRYGALTKVPVPRYARASSSTIAAREAEPLGLPGIDLSSKLVVADQKLKAEEEAAAAADPDALELNVQAKVQRHFRLKEVFQRVELKREDERRIKAALHAVSSYADDTKLSLKAWHFQELSQCPQLKDHHLTMDSRYVELRNTLFREMYALSSAQLVSLCMSAMRLRISWPGFWNKVSKVMMRRISWNKHMTHTMSRFDTATILFAMAKGRAMIRKES